MISVLTPTYNRKYSLPRLYESLRDQVCKDFEWVVVDDGSSDGTSDLISEFQSGSDFPIVYYKQSNSGKHAALNAGVPICSGDWILIVDSDDYLDSDAIALVCQSLKEIELSTVGLCFRRKSIDGGVVGRSLSNEILVMTPTDAGHYYHGDLAYVFSRDAMLKCPFPIFDGERFVPELCIWNKISDMGSVIYFSAICFYVCEYLPDGYSANFKSNLKRNPQGFAYHYRDAFFRERKWIYKMKALIRFLQCNWYQALK